MVNETGKEVTFVSCRLCPGHKLLGVCRRLDGSALDESFFDESNPILPELPSKVIGGRTFIDLRFIISNSIQTM